MATDRYGFAHVASRGCAHLTGGLLALHHSVRPALRTCGVPGSCYVPAQREDPEVRRRWPPDPKGLEDQTSGSLTSLRWSCLSRLQQPHLWLERAQGLQHPQSSSAAALEPNLAPETTNIHKVSKKLPVFI